LYQNVFKREKGEQESRTRGVACLGSIARNTTPKGKKKKEEKRKVGQIR